MSVLSPSSRMTSSPAVLSPVMVTAAFSAKVRAVLLPPGSRPMPYQEAGPVIRASPPFTVTAEAFTVSGAPAAESVWSRVRSCSTAPLTW